MCQVALGFVWLAASMVAVGCDQPPAADCAVVPAVRQRFEPMARCRGTEVPRTLGYAWNGYACEPVLDGGCYAGCEGSDCDALYESRGRCEHAHASCEPTCEARPVLQVRDEVPAYPICRHAGQLGPPVPATFESCDEDDDCRDGVNGQCAHSHQDLVSSRGCVYDECFTDDDCLAGHACAPIVGSLPTVPFAGNLHCITANCRSNADCAADQSCNLHQELGSGAFSPTPSNFSYVCGPPRCPDDTPVLSYRVSSLMIPSREDALVGAVGLDLDGVDDACGHADYPGGVDNAFVELQAQLRDQTPLDLDAELDAALPCREGDSECVSLGVVIDVRTCGAITDVSVRSAAGSVLAGPTRATVADGVFRVQFEHLALAVPIRADEGTTMLALPLRDAVISGRQGPAGISELVLAGTLVHYRLRNALQVLLGQLDHADLQPTVDAIVAGLRDVDIPDEDPACSGISLGLLGAATVDP
ncbi:MAG: hypothetical protein KC668_10365 [Myxococcales bacterium]|nr:hypothetical protein [Myxococcales bacterium]